MAMWFDSWADIARTLFTGSAAYAALVVILRVSGKRTLGQLNAFDFVVTVALGSTLATILLNPSVTWSEGIAAFGVLAAMQFLVAKALSRWPASRHALTSSPAVLLRNGAFQTQAIKSNRLTEGEIRQAVRESGYGDLAAIAAVVLETNGQSSVISISDYGDGSALSDL